MKRLLIIPLALAAIASSACAISKSEVVVGAMYPTGGGQGSGGIEEYRGVVLAADLANSRGGVKGRVIRLQLIPADSADVVPKAMTTLMHAGAKVIVGSYGSTMSAVAARVAARRNVVFWETGAVGLLPQVASDHTFRVPATGETLGRVAVDFVRNVYLPRSRKNIAPKYGVAYVDDVYGRSVGEGAINRIKAAGAEPMTFPYNAKTPDFGPLAKRMKYAGVNVLVVGAYLDDGVALRRAVVREGVPLIANIGTSSSYCMPEFGKRLGAAAVGTFASDKPDGDSVPARALTPEAADVLQWGQREYRRRYHAEMPAAALTGFSGAWALFHSVLPKAPRGGVDEIIAAARETDIPERGLPNGSGLVFDEKPAGPSENLRAASVIWQWVAPNTRAIVWPPAFASRPIAPA